MQYLNTYQFQLFLNDIDQTNNLNPRLYSFSIRDSIHKLYSQLTFRINDITGYMQETLLFKEGMPLKLAYGDLNNIIQSKFILTNGQLEDTFSKDSIGGYLEINGLNAYYKNQKIISKGYKNRISNVIGDVISDYRFKSINIDGTGNDDYWYNPLMNQEDFIYKILLPNSYANDSNDSPFFCYIDINENFFYKNYYNLFNQASIAKLVYNIPQQGNSIANSILTYKRVEIGSLTTKKLRNRNLFVKDRKTALVSSLLQDKTSSYPTSSRQMTIGSGAGIIPTTLDSNLQSYDYLFYKETEPSLDESTKGRRIDGMRDSFFVERVLVTIPLNVLITSGKIIEITMPILSGSNTILSIAHSGKYLVESSDHVWDGESQRGYTSLLLCRKFINVSNQSLIKDLFMQGS